MERLHDFAVQGKSVNGRHPVFVAWSEYMTMSITTPWWVMCLWGCVHKTDMFSHCIGSWLSLFVSIAATWWGSNPFPFISDWFNTLLSHSSHFSHFFFLPGTHNSDSGLSWGFKMINLSHSFLFSFVLSSGRINHMPSCFTWKSTFVFSNHWSFCGTPWIQIEKFTWLSCQKELNSSETFLSRSPWNPACLFFLTLHRQSCY